MKEEFSRKIDFLIQMWSEAGEKRLKEKVAELRSIEAKPEEDFKDLIEMSEVKPDKEERSSQEK
jgi:hypothetical protein